MLWMTNNRTIAFLGRASWLGETICRALANTPPFDQIKLSAMPRCTYRSAWERTSIKRFCCHGLAPKMHLPPFRVDPRTDIVLNQHTATVPYLMFKRSIR